MAGVSVVNLHSDECHWTLLMIWHQAISWANVDSDLCRHMVSLGNNEFKHAIACPRGRDIGCLLWVSYLIFVLPFSVSSYVWYTGILDRDISRVDCAFCWLITWKTLDCWHFVTGMNRLSVDYPHKGSAMRSFHNFVIVIQNKLLSNRAISRWLGTPCRSLTSLQSILNFACWNKICNIFRVAITRAIPPASLNSCVKSTSTYSKLLKP